MRAGMEKGGVEFSLSAPASESASWMVWCGVGLVNKNDVHKTCSTRGPIIVNDNLSTGYTGNVRRSLPRHPVSLIFRFARLLDGDPDSRTHSLMKSKADTSKTAWLWAGHEIGLVSCFRPPRDSIPPYHRRWEVRMHKTPTTSGQEHAATWAD